MIVLTIEEPVGYSHGRGVTHLSEKRQRGFVALINIDIELMEVEDTTGIVAYLMERGGGITLPAEVVEDDKTEFGTTVGGIEIDKVDNADSLSLGVVDHHPYLTVGIDVIGDVGHIVVEHIAGIRYVRRADVPEADIVLDAIEQVEVFGLDGS